MKVIFLDIDGVLNVIAREWDFYGPIFHKHFVENLKTIIDKTGAKLVISSTWRASGIDFMKEMWEFRKLPGEIIDITPTTIEIDETNSHLMDINMFSVERGYEIKQWLKYNKVDNYVIIDDDTDFLPEQMKNFVQTSENTDHEDCVDLGYGLTKKCSELVIKILNK